MMGGYYTRYPPQFFNKYDRVIKGDLSSDTTKKYCIKRSKNLAIVKFEIADQIITRIKKTQRMTFADFLSNIGKNCI